MEDFEKITEKDSLYDNLEQMSVHDLLVNINNEDKKVPFAVEKAIPLLEKLVTQVVESLKKGVVCLYRCRHQWSFGNTRCIRMSAYFWCRR